MHFQIQTNICGNIFCSWLSSGQKKNILIDIWNDAFKTVQGQISKLSVSIYESQSLKKLNFYFSVYQKHVPWWHWWPNFSEVSSWHADFPLKNLSWLWESENAGDSALPAGRTCWSFQAEFSLRDFYLHSSLTRLHRKKISRVCCVHRWFHQQLH